MGTAASLTLSERLLFEIDPMDQADLRQTLKTPACWPIDAEDEKRAHQILPSGPEPLKTGETYLLSYHERGARLWRARRTPSLSPTSRELAEDASAAALDARRAAERAAPWLAAPQALASAAPWRAKSVVACPEHSIEPRLTGSSYGLALALGVVSELTAHPLRDDVIAIATIDAHGHCGPVDLAGLKSKLGLVATQCPRVRTVLVAPDQLDHAQAALPSTTVVGTPSLKEAVVHALPESPVVPPDDFPLLTRQLLALALKNAPWTTDWRSTATTAAWIRDHEHAPAETRNQADLVHRIASRHAGGATLIDPPPADMPRSMRLRLLAHAVQSRTDAGADVADLVALSEKALAEPAARDAVDFELLGALGRATAPSDPSRATDYLEAAITGWASVLELQAASHPLSEYLRLLGVAHRTDAVRNTINRWVRDFWADPHTTNIDLAFTAFATGRALAVCNEPADALLWLDDTSSMSPVVSWSDTPNHLQASRLRWLARVLRPLHRDADAAVAKHRLQALVASDPSCSIFEMLLTLDECIADGHDPSSIVQAVRATPHARAIPHCTNIAEDARQLADAFPY